MVWSEIWKNGWEYPYSMTQVYKEWQSLMTLGVLILNTKYET